MFGEFPVTTILAELQRDNLLPAILFRTSRRQCDNDILRLGKTKTFRINIDQQKQLRTAIDQIMAKYSMQDEVIFDHPHFQGLVTTAVGVHHAGQLLMWRLLLEELMSQGMLRLMIATGTVAAGVDFPARTAIVTAHSRRGSEGFNVLTSAELQQMAGRAGRRGKDAVGLCLVAPSPFSDARVIHEVSKKPPEPLRSAYFAAPSTVLNLLKYRNVDDLSHTVSKSLAAFLDRKMAKGMRLEATRELAEIEKQGAKNEALKRAQKRIRRKEREADELEVRQERMLNEVLKGLETLGHVERGNLTPKGFWAANLCTSLVLELSEAIHDHLLSELSVPMLVGIVASIAGDPHRPYFGIQANPVPKELFKKMQDYVDRVRAAYVNPAANEVKVLPDAALTVLTWMNAESWSEFTALLRLAGVADGDVARLVTQTADHLNQLSRLWESHPDLARTAQEGRMTILKPPLTEALLTE